MANGAQFPWNVDPKCLLYHASCWGNALNLLRFPDFANCADTICLAAAAHLQPRLLMWFPYKRTGRPMSTITSEFTKHQHNVPSLYLNSMSRHYNTRSAPQARPSGGRALTQGVLDTLTAISRPAVNADTLAKIEAEAVASYSWIESPASTKPTIAVPGMLVN